MTMTDGWDDKFDYLRQSRALYHDEDYWRFLIRNAWRIGERPQRIVELRMRLRMGWAITSPDAGARD
jgi:hypothetical protein